MERLVERKKASNEQLDMMLQLLSENEHLARGRILGKKGHAKAWVQIANALNSYEFGAVKTPEKWLQTWRDLRCNTKKRAAKISRGLGERNSLSEFELRVLKLVGVSPVIALDIPESTVQNETSPKVWVELTTDSEQNILENNIDSVNIKSNLMENSNMNMNNTHMNSNHMNTNSMNSNHTNIMNTNHMNAGSMNSTHINSNHINTRMSHDLNTGNVSNNLLNGSESLSNLDSASSSGSKDLPKKRRIQKIDGHNNNLVKLAAQTIRAIGKGATRPDTMVLNTLSASTKRIISVGRFGGKVRTTGLEQEIMSLEQEKIDLQREQFEEMKKYHAARLQAEQDKISLLQGILLTLRQSKRPPTSMESHEENHLFEGEIASVMKNILTKNDVG